MAARHNPGNPAFWDQASCLDALHTWVNEHGHTPSSMRDWRNAGYGHPTAHTCVRKFGSWSAFIHAGGYTPRKGGSAGGRPASESVVSETGTWIYWTRERITEWLLDALLREGRWPTTTELRRAVVEDRPSFETVQRVFGTFAAAKRAAGWPAECEACSRPLGDVRASQRFCSKRCRRAGRAAVVVEAGCTGCGCDLDVYSIGCKRCADRRRKRVARKSGPGVTVESAALLIPVRTDGDSSRPGRCSLTQTAAAAA